MDTCAQHIGPRECGPFLAIEHGGLFTHPPRRSVLRSSWVVQLNVYANWPIWGMRRPDEECTLPLTQRGEVQRLCFWPLDQGGSDEHRPAARIRAAHGRPRARRLGRWF